MSLRRFFREQRVCDCGSFNVRPFAQLMRNAVLRGQNVLHMDVPDDEGVGDERAMAPPRQGLSAHDCDAVFFGKRDETQQLLRELFRLHVVGVASEALVPPCDIDGISFWSPESAYVGHVDVLYACVFEAVREGFLVKLGIMAGTRNATHVNHQRRMVSFEQVKELVKRPRRMPDCQNGQFRHFRQSYRSLIWQ
jgi:hypothetical protein